MHIDSDTQLVSFNLRERYILAQALVLGIEKLAEVEGAIREWSNMHDMADLLKSPMLAPMATAILAMETHTTAATLFHYEDEVEDLPF